MPTIKLHLRDLQTRGEGGRERQQRTSCISVSACQETTAAGCLAPWLQQPSSGLPTFDKTSRKGWPSRGLPHTMYTHYKHIIHFNIFAGATLWRGG